MEFFEIRVFFRGKINNFKNLRKKYKFLGIPL